MPPAISDLEDTASDAASEDEIAPRVKAAPDSETEEEEEEDGPLGEDEFAVEKILNHNYDKDGDIIYQVMWQGYPKKEDWTWEPEDNLETAQEMLIAYFEELGERPPNHQEVPKKSAKSRKRSATAVGSPSTKGKKGQKRGRTSEKATSETYTAPNKTNGYDLPKGSWEGQINTVDTIEEMPNAKTGELERIAYVLWNDGKRSQHPLPVLNTKCPQKMLQYYESHLVFKTNPPDEANGN